MEISPAEAALFRDRAGELCEEGLSKEVFARLFHAYYKRVYKYICYRINNHYAAEDICSHVFETVIAKYASYSPEKANFEVWLFAIARNAVNDYFRSRKRGFAFSLDAVLNAVLAKPSPEELVIRDDNHRALFTALAKLSDKERSIIAMKYGAGLKNSEIAALLGRSSSNIGVVLYRSLKKLHHELDAGGFKDE